MSFRNEFNQSDDEKVILHYPKVALVNAHEIDQISGHIAITIQDESLADAKNREEKTNSSEAKEDDEGIDEEKATMKSHMLMGDLIPNELEEKENDEKKENEEVGEYDFQQVGEILALKQQIWEISEPTTIQILELYIQKNAKMDIRAKWPGVGSGAMGAALLIIGGATGQIAVIGMGAGFGGLSCLLLGGGKLYNLHKTHKLRDKNYMSSFLPHLIEMPKEEAKYLQDKITAEDTVDDVLKKHAISKRDYLLPMGKTIMSALGQYGIYRDIQKITLEYAFKDQSIAKELCPTQEENNTDKKGRCTIL